MAAAAAAASTVSTVARYSGRKNSIQSVNSIRLDKIKKQNKMHEESDKPDYWTIPITVADSYKNTHCSHKRLIGRRGRYNFEYKNMTGKASRYCLDIFSTMIDLHWVAISAIFLGAFVVSWVGFAAIWYLIAFIHNDFAPENLNNPDYKSCVKNGVDFASIILFSLETQTTIGYGFRYTTSHCIEGMALLMLQTCIGTIIQAFMAGFMFAKLGRPKRRLKTIMLSKNAVICKRDNKMTLLIRAADMRPAHIICCVVHALLVKTRITAEGEVIYLEQYKVQMGTEDGVNSEVFLAWPIILGHTIDEDSPLYHLNKENLCKANFELIVFVEGASQSTGQTVQARRSYTPQEIVWGAQFESVKFYQNSKSEYRIDFAMFNEIVQIENFPSKSAYQLEVEDDQSSFSIPSRVAEKDEENNEIKVDFSHKNSLKKKSHL